MMDPELIDLFEPELAPDEKIVWVGKPQQFPITVSTTLGAIFTLVIGSIMLVVSLLALTAIIKHGLNGAFFFLLVALFFLYASLSAIYSGLRLFWGPSQQAYALTNRRAIIAETFLSRAKRSFYVQDIRGFMMYGDDNFGSIIFKKPNLHFNFSHDPLTYQPLGFRNIDDPAKVERLIYEVGS